MLEEYLERTQQTYSEFHYVVTLMEDIFSFQIAVMIILTFLLVAWKLNILTCMWNTLMQA